MGRQVQVRESLPKGTIAAGSKGARSPKQSRSGAPRPPQAARNARPTALVPSLGKKCGRREEEAFAEFSVSFSRASSPRGDGGRHPGLQERVALRGAPRERSPRPARLVRSGFLPGGRSRRRQWGVPWTPRRGTSSAYANQGVRTRAGRHRPHRASGTRPSLGPGPRAPSCHAPTRSALSARGARGRGRSSRPLQLERVSGRLVRGSRGTRSGPGSHRGQAGRNPGGTTGGTGSSGCCAARRVSARVTKLERALERVVTTAPDASEPGRRSRPPSTNARTRRAPDQVPVRRGSCRSRQASSGLE